MTDAELRELIKRPEGDSLDYKLEGYVFPSGRHKFVKDVLAMANTPRPGSAFIVFGVDWSPENGSVIVGLDNQFDDAELQDQFPSTIQPRPRFTYYPLQCDGKQIGILEIPVSDAGPFTAVIDMEMMKNTFKILGGAVYYRRGTQNARAMGSELSRIHTWFLTGKQDQTDIWDTDSWRQLLDAVRQFDPGRNYILAADPLRSPSEVPLHALGLQPWRAVIDFDKESDVNGLLSRVETTLDSHRVVHRAVDANDTVQPEPATHWFFARGLAGLRESVQVGDYVAWLKTHKRKLSSQLDRIAATSSPSPVVAVVIWSDPDLSPYLRTLIAELYAAFMATVEVVVVGESRTLATIVQEGGATFVQMPLREFCHGLAVLNDERLGSRGSAPVLPSSSGAPIELPSDDWLWMSEDLELIHMGSGIAGDDDAGEYRIGGDISWRNLQLRHDCDRDITPAVFHRVDRDLRNRETTRRKPLSRTRCGWN